MSVSALGRRVRKIASATTTEYVYDLAGNVVAEFQGSTSGWRVGYVYLGGSLLAQYRDSTTYFAHQDHLGSTRLLTKVDKSVYDLMDYMPYGEQTAGDTGTTHKFTGKERDSESGLDYFGARYHMSNLGRFMSPDPDNASAFLYMDDPQSWNGYVYARNNPLLYTDPSGQWYLVCRKDDKGKEVECGKISDKEYGELERNRKDLEFREGNIYAVNQNGSRTLVGSYEQKDVDLDSPAFLAVARGTQMGEPGVNAAAAGLRAFGYIVAPVPMILAECLAGGCSKAEVAVALLPGLGKSIEGVKAVDILAKYVKGSVKAEFPSEFLNLTLKEIRELARAGDARARKALKLLTKGEYRK